MFVRTTSGLSALLDQGKHPVLAHAPFFWIDQERFEFHLAHIEKQHAYLSQEEKKARAVYRVVAERERELRVARASNRQKRWNLVVKGLQVAWAIAVLALLSVLALHGESRSAGIPVRCEDPGGVDRTPETGDESAGSRSAGIPVRCEDPGGVDRTPETGDGSAEPPPATNTIETARVLAALHLHPPVLMQPGYSVARMQVRNASNAWTDVGLSGTAISLPVNCTSGCAAGASFADNSAFTAGTTSITNVGGVFNDGLAAVTSGNAANPRITAQRGLHINLRNNAGTEIGTSGAPVRVDPTGTTTQPVSGTVTANAGTGTFTTDPTDRAARVLGRTFLRNPGDTANLGDATTPVRVDPTGTTTQPVSGTVTSNQGGAPWTQRIQDGAGATLATVTAGNALKVDGSAVTQPVSGTVTANAGTNLNTSALALDASVAGLSLTQGAATSGQKAALIEGAVTTGAPTYTTGNSNPISLTTAGALRTDSSAMTQPVSGTVTANAGTGNFSVVGTASDNTANSTAKLPVIAALANSSNPAWTSGNQVPLSVLTTGAMRHDVTSVAGTATTTGNGTTSAGSQRVTIASDNSAIANWGLGATGSAVPSGAQYSAARAATANPTNATGGNMVGVMADKAGRLVTTAGQVRELVGVQATTISATTETTFITAGGAGVFNDLTSLIITTAGAAAATITVKDATAGTTRLLLDYPNAALAPGTTLVLNFSQPIPQAAANNNWTITNSVATTIHVTAVFLKNL